MAACSCQVHASATQINLVLSICVTLLVCPLLVFLPVQTEFCMTSEAGGGIGGRLQSYAGLDGDIYLRGGGGPEATGVLNTG
jgi:hypothetical protein